MTPMGDGKGPGRNRCSREISFIPNVTRFKPVGIPMRDLESVNLTHVELEAMRLVDLNGLDHETASSKMRISRRVFAIDLKNGRRKVMEALANGLAINIEGGEFVYRKDVDIQEED